MAKSEKIIIKGTLISPGRHECTGWLELQGDIIGRVGNSGDLPLGGQVFDFGENLVCPGFIDLHVHGGGGYDVMDCSVEALVAIARFHAGGGTTAFLGATMSAGYARLKDVLAAAAEHRRRKHPAGAMLLGLHLEGPYLNPVKKGAHSREELRLPDTGEMQALLAETEGLPAETAESVRMVTLAPELPGSLELIAFLHWRKIKVALGHSVAGYDDLTGAISAGLSHGTHMFNAMGEFRHRDPGTAGYLMQMPEITVDVIADGAHVHPVVVGMLLKLKGPDKVALITDAIRAAGMPDGCYELGGRRVAVRAGEAWLVDDTPGGNTITGHTLAGSTLTMNRAVAYMVQVVGVPLVQAVQMASLNPARILGLEGFCGKLEPGLKGNVTVMDKDFNVVATFVEGKRVV